MSWTWTGAGATDSWTDGGNWSEAAGNGAAPPAGSYPSTGYGGDVYIAGPATIDLSVNQTTPGNQDISYLYITGGDVSIVGAGTLAIGAGLQITAGATLSLGSDIAIGGSSTISISGTGTATISGGSFDNGKNPVVVSAGQNLLFTGGTSIEAASISGGNGTGTVTLNGASLNLQSGGSSVPIYFDNVPNNGTPNILQIPNYASGMTLENLGYGDQIYANGDTLTLVLNKDGVSYSLEDTHGGNYTSILANDVTLANGVSLDDFAMDKGYFVYDGAAPPCFYEGTMIATPSGEQAVEMLRAGDMVRLANGRVVPVRWVGFTRVSTRFADKLRSLPIRIKAGALAEGVPARDLLVSPDHALFLQGVLVQAGALVNGAGIIREEQVPERFTYYHVELASHELLLAEGAPAESFVDNIDRMNFHNWTAREAPHERILEMDCPRAKSARQLPAALRLALAARAGLFGLPQAA